MSVNIAEPSSADKPICTLPEYAALITRIGLTSFGGGVSGWMMRMVVQERAWMTEPEFLSGLALCQIFPGINVLNLSIWLGYKLHGGAGALVGALGNDHSAGAGADRARHRVLASCRQPAHRGGRSRA